MAGGSPRRLVEMNKNKWCSILFHLLVPSFLKLFSTYAIAFRTERGELSAREKKRSAHNLPVRETSRFTRRAMRIASPCIPRERDCLLSASTIKCRWSPCTEKCVIRKSPRARTASANALRTVGNTNWLRSERSALGASRTRAAPVSAHAGHPFGSSRQAAMTPSLATWQARRCIRCTS